MNYELFMNKYGNNNSIKKVILRNAYKRLYNRQVNKSVECKVIATQISQRETRHASRLKQKTECELNEISMHSSRNYKILEEKWLPRQDEQLLNKIKIKKQLELSIEKQRHLEELQIQEALIRREINESDRKHKFFKEQNTFRCEQNERKLKELQNKKCMQEESLRYANKLAEEEERNRLEERILHRQKCKLQFEMLEQQRKTNQLLQY